VELGARREKAPRRVIHFSSGETMEEYSTDEEEPERRDLLAPPGDGARVRVGGVCEDVCVYFDVCVCMCVRMCVRVHACVHSKK